MSYIKMFVLKVACPQSRLSSKSSVLNVACPQSCLSSKSRPQRLLSSLSHSPLWEVGIGYANIPPTLLHNCGGLQSWQWCPHLESRMIHIHCVRGQSFRHLWRRIRGIFYSLYLAQSLQWDYLDCHRHPAAQSSQEERMASTLCAYISAHCDWV